MCFFVVFRAGIHCRTINLNDAVKIEETREEHHGVLEKLCGKSSAKETE